MIFTIIRLTISLDQLTISFDIILQRIQSINPLSRFHWNLFITWNFNLKLFFDLCRLERWCYLIPWNLWWIFDWNNVFNLIINFLLFFNLLILKFFSNLQNHAIWSYITIILYHFKERTFIIILVYINIILFLKWGEVIDNLHFISEFMKPPRLRTVTCFTHIFEYESFYHALLGRFILFWNIIVWRLIHVIKLEIIILQLVCNWIENWLFFLILLWHLLRYWKTIDLWHSLFLFLSLFLVYWLLHLNMNDWLLYILVLISSTEI